MFHPTPPPLQAVRRLGGWAVFGSLPSTYRPTHLLSYRLLAAAIVACVASVVTPAHAQYPDARLVPSGALSVSFEPRYMNYRERLDAGGTLEPLGTDFSDSAAGARLFPTLVTSQDAVRAMLGDDSYAMTAGAFQTALDADIRTFPFNFRFGLSSRITLTASIPVVTTRAQVSFVVDSASANVGWNQVATAAGNVQAATQIQTLLADLESAAQFVEAQIAAGAYGCPSSPSCTAAQDAVTRARAMAVNVSGLSGLDAAGTVAPELPPFAPLASSAAGAAIVQAIATLSTELQSLGAPALTASFPLPTGTLGTDDVGSVLSDPEFGYEALPLAFTRFRQKLGDVELGLRYGLVQRSATRAVVFATARLPTGTLDDPDNFVDIGTGDRQTDVELGFEGFVQAGSFVALAASAAYNFQFSQQLPRRITSHDRPFAPLSTLEDVNRNLGDMLWVGLYPSLRLAPAFTAYGSATYFRRSADRVTLAGTSPGSSPDPAVLEFETSMESMGFGGGIAYHAVRASGLPVEAGVDYRTVFSGSGGQMPKSTSLHFYLRLSWRIFGGGSAPAGEPPGQSPAGPPIS
ncbi:MAG: hypothetical protein OEO17_11530 [Gemmatimonadota bacterium]|nr:hypothetical protein [Gemmatimonadota bacterium]MDH5551387.1 hypothetical protein [Gemmatimonadota bacterium]